MAFILAGAQVGDEAVWRGEGDSGSGEGDALAVEEAEFAACEGYAVDDRAEAARSAVARVVVARRVEDGGAEAVEVVVLGDLGGGELGVDVVALAGDFVELIGSVDLIEGVGDVVAADVAVAGPAEVAGVDAVGDDVADGGGAFDPAVLVVVNAGLVADEVVAELGGVAGGEEILDEDVGERDLAAAAVERVEAAVGVLLEEVEAGDVVLDAVGLEIAEEADAGVARRRR